MSAFPLILAGVGLLALGLIAGWVALLIATGRRQSWGAFVAVLIVGPLLGLGGLVGLGALTFVSRAEAARGAAMRAEQERFRVVLAERKAEDVALAAAVSEVRIVRSEPAPGDLERRLVLAAASEAAFRELVENLERRVDSIEIVGLELPYEHPDLAAGEVGCALHYRVVAPLPD